MTKRSKHSNLSRKSRGAQKGERFAISFANMDLSATPQDSLYDDYFRFVGFLAAHGVVSAAARPALLDLWSNAPDETAVLLEKAGSLRSALRNAFMARVSGEEIHADAIRTINEILEYTEGHERLEPVNVREEGQPEWKLALHARGQGLEWLLTAIARNAAELIAEGPAAPIRKCANPNCGLLFYDDSRTGRRRWCSMAVCGNRAKVAAHYRRKKTKQ